MRLAQLVPRVITLVATVVTSPSVARCSLPKVVRVAQDTLVLVLHSVVLVAWLVLALQLVRACLVRPTLVSVVVLHAIRAVLVARRTSVVVALVRARVRARLVQPVLATVQVVRAARASTVVALLLVVLAPRAS